MFEVFESCASAKLALGRAAAGGGAARVGRRAATADPRNRMGRGPPKEDPQNQPCAEEEDLWSSMYAIVLNLVLDNQPNLGRLLRADNFVAKLILVCVWRVYVRMCVRVCACVCVECARSVRGVCAECVWSVCACAHDHILCRMWGAAWAWPLASASPTSFPRLWSYCCTPATNAHRKHARAC